MTFLLTLITGVGIQIATNIANDFFDYVKGADTENRKGPMRLTQSGAVTLPIVRTGMWVSLLIPTLTGVYLIIQGGWVIAALLALALVLAVAYTAGPLPLAYVGLGDLFVLVFFGPVAVAATHYLQTGSLSSIAFLAGMGPGLISCAILSANNLRDVEEDRVAGKKTLVVRFGSLFGKFEYLTALALSVVIPFFAAPGHPFIFLLLAALIPMVSLFIDLFRIEDVRQYNLLLEKTGKCLLLYTVIFSFAWML
jgi:1,4-dihydroxy-2-naphthoate octaprenyltransferase